MKSYKTSPVFLFLFSGSLFLPISKAGETDGFEFHGYFRAGVLFSVEDDLKRSKFPATKETLGRLGIESDNHYELALQKNFEMENGDKIRIKTRAGADNNNDDATNQLSSSVNGGDIGIMETFVEFEGITDSGIVWGGKRFYGKDNYISMTDFFYTDMSGVGTGVEQIKLGTYVWDFAYIASDKNDNDAGRYGDNTNNTMHSVHVGINFGSFELHSMAKYLPDNCNTVDDSVLCDFAETGFEMTGIYHLESLWGLPGNGFSDVIAQVGTGLGSGQLLGGTITEFNAFKPGTSRGQGQGFITQVREGDHSARFLTWGGLLPEESKMNYFTSLQAQYNDFDDGGSDYWASALIRPSYNVSEHFVFATEIGIEQTGFEDPDGSKGDAVTYKVTLAPTLVVRTSMGPAPEIRFLATYLDGSDRESSDVILGVQADMWW